jgi:glycopeptide antibiotics resistance protein
MSWLLGWVGEPLAVFGALAIVIVLASVPVAVWRARERRFLVAAARTGRDVALLVALALIATLTFAPLEEEVPRLPVNLLPFRDQLLALQGQIEMGRALSELAANVVLFVPLGIALAWRWRRPSVRAVALWALAVSVAVEAGQAVLQTGRQADVTDLLANVSGAVLGLLLVRRLGRRHRA